jgi:hypothetical protein
MHFSLDRYVTARVYWTRELGDAMKTLTREKQTQIVTALIEGNSIRATARMFNVSKDTVFKLQVGAGCASADYQRKTFHGPSCKRVRCDEVWAFCYAKQKNVPA